MPEFIPTPLRNKIKASNGCGDGQQMEKTPRDFIFDNLLSMSAYWACAGTIIASLTAYYGFSLALSNVVTGLSGTLPVLQLAGGLAYERTGRPLRFLRLYNGAWRVLLPMVFFSVLLPRVAGAPLMVVSYVLAIGIYQFACPSQTDWLVSSVEGRVRGDYYSVREMFFMLTYTGVFCEVSLIIDRAARHGAQRAGFLAVGVLEAVLLATSLTVLLRLPAPERAEKAPRTRAAASMLEPLRNRRFRRVMLTNMVWSLSGMFIGGFAAVYQIRVLELTFFEIMLWATAGNLCRSLCTPLMARLAARIGWKNVTALTIAMMACVAALWAAATRENAVYLFPVLSILGAVPYAGMGVGFLKMQVATSPAATRSMYFSVNSLFNGAAALLGSVLCSALIGVLEVYPPHALRFVFFVGLAGALVAAVMAARIPCREV